MDFGSVFCSPLEKNVHWKPKHWQVHPLFLAAAGPVFPFKKWLAKMVGKSIVSLLKLVQ